MSNFVSDSDLLEYEPQVFQELPFASQRMLLVTDGAISGPTLTSGTGGFAALSAGDVVVISSGLSDVVTCGVASVTDSNTLVLMQTPVLAATTGLRVEARTLAPQANTMHAELLRSLGVDLDDPDGLRQSAIISVSLMRRLEALGTLSRAYAAAVTLGGDNATVSAKAESYRRRFNAAANGARVLMDVDGDGRADVWRTPGVARLVRV
jgi:hypothetical protein